MSKTTKADVYETVNSRIIECLERGTLPWQSYIASASTVGAPVSVSTGREYRGFNAFSLAIAGAMRGFTSPFWVTFNQAKERGAKVRKGAKSEAVTFWTKWKPKDSDDPERMIVRYYRVFNVAEVEGLPAEFYPEAAAPVSEFEAITAAQRIIDDMPNRPELRHEGRLAFYEPGADRVTLPRPTTFPSAPEYYSTAFHEFVHATGHASRLGRLKPGAKFGSQNYTVEELVAEFGAAFLCGCAGISAPVVENQAAYIDGWLRQLRKPDSKRWLVQAAGKAQRAADYVRGISVANGAADEIETEAAAA